jgi:hypothetical protein
MRRTVVPILLLALACASISAWAVGEIMKPGNLLDLMNTLVLC